MASSSASGTPVCAAARAKTRGAGTAGGCGWSGGTTTAGGRGEAGARGGAATPATHTVVGLRRVREAIREHEAQVAPAIVQGTQLRRPGSRVIRDRHLCNS